MTFIKDSELIPSDFELVTKLKKDDVKAFDLLYSKYAINLYRFALKYLRSVEEAEELVQSVFMKIWEIRSSIRTDTSFKSFIYTIAYNSMCTIFRKRKYNKEFIKEAIYLDNQTDTDTEDKIDSRSLLDKVERIIDNLPEKQKVIFLKSRNEGKSTKEIANEIGLSPGTVDNYISASLKVIKSKLKSESINNLSVFLFIMWRCFTEY